MNFDLVTVWWFPVSYGMMVTKSVSQQLLFSDLENFLLSSGVSRFSFLNIEHIGKHGNDGKFYSVVFFKASTLFQQKFFKLSTMLFRTIFLAFIAFKKTWKYCSKIKNLIVVWVSLAAKSELDIESSCGH